jgi:hypothetical protein
MAGSCRIARREKIQRGIADDDLLAREGDEVRIHRLDT